MRQWIWMAALAAALAGCSTLDDLFRGGPREQSRDRRDVTQYACAGGKSFAARIEQDGKSAWVVLPEREFRLDRVAGAETRYGNGRTTLTVKGDELVLDEPGAPPLTGCRRPS